MAAAASASFFALIASFSISSSSLAIEDEVSPLLSLRTISSFVILLLLSFFIMYILYIIFLNFTSEGR